MPRDFGYKPLKDESIDFDRQDLRMARFILAQEPSWSLCIGCGSCTGTCTAGHFRDFNIRRIHTMVRRGDTAFAKSMISHCMFCGKCQLVCPRGVNLRNLILAINKAIEQIG